MNDPTAVTLPAYQPASLSFSNHSGRTIKGSDSERAEDDLNSVVVG